MFNEKLKAARKQKGLSQTELGKLLGVQAQTIGRWETGKSKPNLETDVYKRQLLSCLIRLVSMFFHQPFISST